MFTAAGLAYIETDHLGTPRVVIDAGSNQALWRWPLTGSAFGEHAPDEDVFNTGKNYLFNLRFPGQYFDAESGLHYNYFRDYEPGTGSYIQSDPIGLFGGMNTYAYVDSMPLIGTDPFGLDRIMDCAMGGFCNPSDEDWFDHGDPLPSNKGEFNECVFNCARGWKIGVPCYLFAVGVGLGAGSMAGLCSPPTSAVTGLTVASGAFTAANYGCRVSLAATTCRDYCRRCADTECK